MHRFTRKFIACSVAATMAVSGSLPAFAAEPVVKGPETVDSWYKAGEDFIVASNKIKNKQGKAKNVILFVGDGMGISTVTAARILDGQMKGKPGEENRLFFETFPHLALSKTYSWDQQTSDSAPTMTAMVTGYKGREGQLSVNHTTTRGECRASVITQKSLPTILEEAAAAGKSTGVVSTARITHATPAATFSHTSVRDWENDANITNAASCADVPANERVKDIAAQLIELSPTVRSSLKVVLGGGRSNFLRNDQADPENTSSKGARRDGRDLTAEWVSTRNQIATGSKFVFDKTGFNAATPANTPFLLGLFERSHLQYEADRANDTAGEPSLSEMTAKSIQMLQQNKKGFFLHVEGGRIDHAHHAGNAQRALIDAIEFAKAVKTAYEMTDPKNTLILVTADHSHTFTIAGYPHRGNDILGLVKEVPNVDGEQPEAALASDNMPFTTLGYANGPGAAAARTAPLTSAQVTQLNYLQEATVPLGSETHAGEEVAIYASGPKSHLVKGTMEQNWIYHVMRNAFGFKKK
ncbi:alkaline phosphatase [Methylobacillus flagellatus]|uniref:alkaline phosphatase n=1 Tax=Methylobacillus flagellatus TaxID=405 RepID=UPI0010F762B7|nr:alkaline phosphatase [Methylobacillus flagellatus]